MKERYLRELRQMSEQLNAHKARQTQQQKELLNFRKVGQERSKEHEVAQG